MHWFPNKNKRKEMIQVDTKTTSGKPQWMYKGKRLQPSDLGENIYCAYDKENCQIWVNPKHAARGKQIVENCKFHAGALEIFGQNYP